MKRLILALAFAGSLAGCAGQLPSLDLNTTVSRNTMLGVESAYGIALSGERAYKSLPLCLTGATESVINPCARRSVIVRLQAADLKAISAIRSANTFIKKYPTVDASNVIGAAQLAVGSLQSILGSAGVK